MSFTVAIVLPPIPDHDAEAWTALTSFIEEAGPTPDIFRVLHDHLTAKYPCSTTFADEDVDDGVWSDGPLIDDFGHRAAVLGIASSRMAEVMPFLIETATALGCTVFDEQEGTIHRPGSKDGPARRVAQLL
jgi:hypothetical protein